MSLGKFIREKRAIYIYKKTKSDLLGEHVNEIEVNSIDLEVLKSIVEPNIVDPYLLDAYPLNLDQINKLELLLGNKIGYDQEQYEYYLECYGVYE